MQLSQTLSAAIAQIKVPNSPITNHTEKDLAPAPSFFLLFFKIFQVILYILSPHYSLISNCFAYYSLISIKNGHYSLISKPHLDPPIFCTLSQRKHWTH